mmetsp:Transcript_19634/g.59394  ORF Transcript_19634/g.59394 Transcript_19634/m.59394 type:complete len:333 (-) Transcript_19634:996-1994(-)
MTAGHNIVKAPATDPRVAQSWHMSSEESDPQRRHGSNEWHTCELLVQGVSRLHPEQHDGQKDGAQVRGGRRQGSKGHNHDLLDESASRLAQGVAHHVDGSLALQLSLLVQGDVGHLLARVEQGVLGGLGEHVLCRTHQHRRHEGRQAPRGQHWVQRRTKQHQRKEDDTGDQQHGGGDERCHTPAELAEHEAGQQHHGERDGASSRREVAHEGGVVVGVGELLLDLRLPGHLHQVDTDAICDHQSSKVPDVRRLGEEGEALADGQVFLVLLGLGRQLSHHAWHHRALQPPVGTGHQQAANDHQSHEALQGLCPAIHARGKTRTFLRKVYNSAA